MEWPFQLFAQILIFLTDTTATFVRNVEMILIIIVNIVIVIIINIIVFNRSVRSFRINRNIPRLTDGGFATPYPDVQYRKKKKIWRKGTEFDFIWWLVYALTILIVFAVIYCMWWKRKKCSHRHQCSLSLMDAFIYCFTADFGFFKCVILDKDIFPGICVYVIHFQPVGNGLMYLKRLCIATSKLSRIQRI